MQPQFDPNDISDIFGLMGSTHNHNHHVVVAEPCPVASHDQDHHSHDHGHHGHGHGHHGHGHCHTDNHHNCHDEDDACDPCESSDSCDPCDPCHGYHPHYHPHLPRPPPSAVAFASNTAAWASNAAAAPSNASTLSFASNVAAYASNAAAFASNAAASYGTVGDASFYTAAAVWASNAIPEHGYSSEPPAPQDNPEHLRANFVEVATGPESGSMYFVDTYGVGKLLYDSRSARDATFASNAATWLSNSLPAIVETTSDPTNNSHAGKVVVNAATGSVFYVDYDGKSVRLEGAFASNTATWLSNSMPAATAASMYASNAGTWGSNTATWLSNNLPRWRTVTATPPPYDNPPRARGQFAYNATTQETYFVDYEGTANMVWTAYDSNTATWASNVASVADEDVPTWVDVASDPLGSNNAPPTQSRFTFNKANSNVFFVDRTGRAHALQRDYWVYPPNKPYAYTESNVVVGSADYPVTGELPTHPLEVFAPMGEDVARVQVGAADGQVVFGADGASHGVGRGAYGDAADAATTIADNTTMMWSQGGDIVLSTAPDATATTSTDDLKERVRITKDGLVGMGKVSPLAKLHVVHDTGIAATGITSENPGCNNTYRIVSGLAPFATFWRLDQSNLHVLVTNRDDQHGVSPSDKRPFSVGISSGNVFMCHTAGGTASATTGNNGRVAIGHDRPKRLLHLASTRRAVMALSSSSPADDSDFVFMSSGGCNAGEDPAIGYARTASLRIGAAATIATDQTDSGWTEHMCCIGSTGYVGVGTPSPDAHLTVAGNVHVGGSNHATATAIGAYVSLAQPSSKIEKHLPWYGIGCAASGNVSLAGFFGLGLYTRNADKTGYPPALYIDYNGRVGIGGFSSNDLPLHLLHLKSDDAAKPGGGTWDTPSDVRLKEDIVDADVDVCYDNVKNLPLVYYKWRDDVFPEESVHDRHKLGWIAQDVQQVFPRAVKEMAAYGLGDCLTLNADQVYAATYGAVQKLIRVSEGHTEGLKAHAELLASHDAQVDEIAALKTQVATLTDELAALKKMVTDALLPLAAAPVETAVAEAEAEDGDSELSLAPDEEVADAEDADVPALALESSSGVEP